MPKLPSYKTIIATPLCKSMSEQDKKSIQDGHEAILKKVKELLNDKDALKAILDELPNNLDTTIELVKENRKRRIIKLLNLAGLYTDDEIQLYEDALKYSTPGYSIILERDLNEIFINSYSPEWARAWNGNTDLQVCLDYFAVITYITEYYTKDDSGIMTKLIEMLKKSECSSLKEKMILV